MLTLAYKFYDRDTFFRTDYCLAHLYCHDHSIYFSSNEYSKSSTTLQKKDLSFCYYDLLEVYRRMKEGKLQKSLKHDRSSRYVFAYFCKLLRGSVINDKLDPYTKYPSYRMDTSTSFGEAMVVVSLMRYFEEGYDEIKYYWENSRKFSKLHPDLIILLIGIRMKREGHTVCNPYTHTKSKFKNEDTIKELYNTMMYTFDRKLFEASHETTTPSAAIKKTYTSSGQQPISYYTPLNDKDLIKYFRGN